MNNNIKFQIPRSKNQINPKSQNPKTNKNQISNPKIQKTIGNRQKAKKILATFTVALVLLQQLAIGNNQ